MRTVKCIALLATAVSAPAFAAPQWTISQAAGPVMVIQDKGEARARTGRPLPAGATVVTGAHAKAILVRGGQFIVLAPNRRLRLPDARSQAGQRPRTRLQWSDLPTRIVEASALRETPRLLMVAALVMVALTLAVSAWRGRKALFPGHAPLPGPPPASNVRPIRRRKQALPS